jgi:hypothetical protein
MRRIRGFIDLVFDVVDETSNLVELTHDEVVVRTVRRFAPVEPVKTVAKLVTGIQGAIAGTVFKSIRGINGATRRSFNVLADVVETGLRQPLEVDNYALATPMQSSAVGSLNWCVDYLQSSLNGFWGDYLSARNNALADGMTLRSNGRALPIRATTISTAFPNATGKVCVLRYMVLHRLNGCGHFPLPNTMTAIQQKVLAHGCTTTWVLRPCTYATTRACTSPTTVGNWQS